MTLTPIGFDDSNLVHKNVFEVIPSPKDFTFGHIAITAPGAPYAANPDGDSLIFMLSNLGKTHAQFGWSKVSDGAYMRTVAGDSLNTVRDTLLIANGKLTFNGKPVFYGDKQPAIANHATDATVNAILSALRAVGIIAA